ncbi:helix-turn-helix domain-containing protein [Bacteroides thetaiotaomicron]|uniref:helix-turn-helix domain-containing protein n=1 Tax=Phocaeicola vulgatus TaxID=821 RepID=UPI0039B4BD6F
MNKGLWKDKVKKLLTQTDLPLWEVVEVCGFVSQSYLTKFYPMNFGASPGEIRRRL